MADHFDENYTAYEFERIDTEARLRGQLITSSYVFRAKPATYEEYRRISDAHFRAYPGPECSPKVSGIFVGGNDDY